MSKISSINDFVIKFANVNGSGSASANQTFAKGVFRSGIPVSPKNIFPSNIQGLPTWFEVRVNEKGYLGRREGVDIAVAMNPQSYVQDVKHLYLYLMWYILLIFIPLKSNNYIYKTSSRSTISVHQTLFIYNNKLRIYTST